MQNKQQNTNICNKYTNYAKSYHGATGSDTTSVASRMSFDTWLLVLRVKLSCVLCMWTFTSFTLCVSILNIQYMQYNKLGMHNMQKHTKYATYAKTSNICNICKIYQICKISNKIPKYAINIPIMQNHAMEPLAATQRQSQNTRHHCFKNVF